ncbi:MAG: cytochrome b [Acetobacteraceae bacterium]|nr:cytochrome b [Acetobacteraceae bacterium]
MQPVSPQARSYDQRTILFHWFTLGLIAVQWVLAQVIDDFPKGAPRVAARSTHIILGLLILAVVVGRIVWRATEGRRLPAADRGALHVAAKATHWGMYALICIALLLGLFTAWAQGDSIYGLFRIPAFDPTNHDLGDQVAGVHGTVVTILLILIGIHAAAALIHQYVWKDHLLRRMAPGRKEPSTP